MIILTIIALIMVSFVLLLAFFILLISLYLLFKSDSYGAPFVDNKQSVIIRAIEILKLESLDIFYDLGSGSGQVLTIAYNTNNSIRKIVGIERSLLAFVISKIRIGLFYRNSEINIINENLLDYDFSEATAIYVYLFPNILEKLKPKFIKMIENNCRIVSCVFEIKGIEPKQIISVYHPTFRKIEKIYLY